MTLTSNILVNKAFKVKTNVIRVVNEFIYYK